MQAFSMARQHSHFGASTSSVSSSGHCPRRSPAFARGVRGASRTLHHHQSHAAPHIARALFDPPPFSPDKLSVSYRVGDSWSSAPQPGAQPNGEPPRRCYTLTHNDITGALSLTVDTDYNYRQISGFYTKLLRDEVTAEWKFDHPHTPSLHIYCYVSGQERWLAPAPLRNYIFRREIPLVLDTFLYADRHLLEQQPELADAEVYVHFKSGEEDLNKVELWGTLGKRSTWQVVPMSMLKRALWALTGQQFQQQQQQPQPQQQVTTPSKAFQTTLDVGQSWQSSAVVTQQQQQQQQPHQRERQQRARSSLQQMPSDRTNVDGPREADAAGTVPLVQQLASCGQQGQGHTIGCCCEAEPLLPPQLPPQQQQELCGATSSRVSSSSHSSSSSSHSSSGSGSRRNSSSGKHRSAGYVAIDKSELLVNRGSSSLQWQGGGTLTSAGAIAATTELDIGVCLSKGGGSSYKQSEAARLQTRS